MTRVSRRRALYSTVCGDAPFEPCENLFHWSTEVRSMGEAHGRLTECCPSNTVVGNALRGVPAAPNATESVPCRLQWRHSCCTQEDASAFDIRRVNHDTRSNCQVTIAAAYHN